MANSFDGSKYNNLAVAVIVAIIIISIFGGVIGYVASFAIKATIFIMLVLVVYGVWKYISK